MNKACEPNNKGVETMKTQYQQFKTKREMKVEFMGEYVIVPKGSTADNMVQGESYENVFIWIDYPADHHLKHDLDYRGLRLPKVAFMTNREYLHQ